MVTPGRIAWLLLPSTLLACQREEARLAPPPRRATQVAPTPAPPPAIPAPRGAFSADRLRCARLLPKQRAKALLGYVPRLFERIVRRDGTTGLVCSHRTQRPQELFSFQVICGADQVPSAYAGLRRLHAGAGSRPARLGLDGIATRSSYLFRHPHRPCFVQVAGRGIAKSPAHLERVAAQIASGVP